LPGPSINLAQSPDLLHWKPVEKFTIQPRKHSLISDRVGGGAPPIEIEEGWLVLFHGVEHNEDVGVYRTFICLLDRNKPFERLSINYEKPILESDSGLTDNPELIKYVSNVVFTTGIEKYKDYYIIASGELDLCCRITHIHKNDIDLNKKVK